MKNIGIAFGVVILVLFGMNQYESYKLNKAANDGIEAMQKVMTSSMNKQKESSTLDRDVAMVNSALATMRQRRVLEGNFLPLIDLSEGGRVFSTIDYRANDCLEDSLSTQCWKHTGSVYKYITSTGDEIIFMFDMEAYKLKRI